MAETGVNERLQLMKELTEAWNFRVKVAITFHMLLLYNSTERTLVHNNLNLILGLRQLIL